MVPFHCQAFNRATEGRYEVCAWLSITDASKTTNKNLGGQGTQIYVDWGLFVKHKQNNLDQSILTFTYRLPETVCSLRLHCLHMLFCEKLANNQEPLD